MLRSTLLLLVALPLQASDWIHWRGPEQNGYSPEKGLPDRFNYREAGKDNLLWKSNIGGRSTPLILDGKLYLICAGEGEGVNETERVVCMNADTGALIWEKNFGVFHTDIVSSRLGWTTLTADPDAKTIFCHGTQGDVYCFDATSGDIKWKHNLTEEFGRFTGYGGRVVSPIFSDGLVIVGIVSSSWGNHARGANRYVAFNSTTGQIVWWCELPTAMKGTYYSSPIVTNIGGVRQLVTGAADGAVVGIKIRTGELLWSYHFSALVVNPSPIVHNERVYISHGEENPEGGSIGRVICIDPKQLDDKKKPKLIWEVKNLSKRFGLASSALADGVFYVPDDASELVAFDITNGAVLWKYKYGTSSRGAPLIADGKLYIFDVFGPLSILKLNGKRRPEELAKINFKPKNGVGLLETHGTPIAVNGRLYFCTREGTYCVTDANKKHETATLPPPLPEKPVPSDAVGIRIFPADITANAGGEVRLTAVFVDASGREAKAPDGAIVEWTLPTPPVPPGGKSAPPPLKGAIKSDGMVATVTLEKMPAQQGYVLAKAGKLTSPLARVRVAAATTYVNDFEKTPEGAPPAGWVNATGKFVVKMGNRNMYLTKVNNDSRPPFARSIGYITNFDSSDYIIECKVMGSDVRGKLPDIGIINSRYNLILDGKPDSDFGNKRTLRIVAWEALPRINYAVAFDWKPDVWYHLKLMLDSKGKSSRVLGKAWDWNSKEPEKWTIEFEDPNPYRNGAAALYGYVTNMLEVEQDGKKITLPGSDIYYDDLKITPAKGN